jgi:hypothetical protein
MEEAHFVDCRSAGRQIPALTAEANQRTAALQYGGKYDSVKDRPLAELPAGVWLHVGTAHASGSVQQHHQIVQTPGT